MDLFLKDYFEVIQAYSRTKLHAIYILTNIHLSGLSNCIKMWAVHICVINVPPKFSSHVLHPALIKRNFMIPVLWNCVIGTWAGGDQSWPRLFTFSMDGWCPAECRSAIIWMIKACQSLNKFLWMFLDPLFPVCEVNLLDFPLFSFPVFGFGCAYSFWTISLQLMEPACFMAGFVMYTNYGCQGYLENLVSFSLNFLSSPNDKKWATRITQSFCFRLQHTFQFQWPTFWN